MTLTPATMGELERYEAYADRFHVAHRMVAPGKDTAAAVGVDVPWVERYIRFGAFLELLGPCDRAALLSVWLLEWERWNEG